MGIIN